SAAQGDVLCARRATSRERLLMMELERGGCATTHAPRVVEGAAPAVTVPDRTANGGRDVARGLRGPWSGCGGRHRRDTVTCRPRWRGGRVPRWRGEGRRRLTGAIRRTCVSVAHVAFERRDQLFVPVVVRARCLGAPISGLQLANPARLALDERGPTAARP